MTDAQFSKLERMFEKALGNEIDSGADGKSSIIKRNGEYIVNVDRDIFHGAPKKDYPKILKQWLDENFDGVEIASLVDDDILTLSKRGNKELAYGKNTQILPREKKIVKNQLSAHIDEVARVAQTHHLAPDKQLESGKLKHGTFAEDGWKYKDFLFQIKDNVYVGSLNVALNKNGKYTYDITNIDEVTNKKEVPTSEISGSNGTRIVIGTSDTNTISQNQDSVNSSISDSAQNDTEKPSMKTSKFYDSTQNTDNLTQETKDAIAEQAEAFEYEGINNKETIQKALKEFQNNPLKTASQFLSTSPKQARTVDIAKGFVLLQKYQEMGEYSSAVEVAKKLREIGTQKGQEVQAFSILNRLTPEGMLYYAQGELDSALEIIGEKKGKEWLDKNRDKFKLTDDEAYIDIILGVRI
ncbi:MAG: hypothetical protein HFI90_03325 [Clostridia bacterium]|nr:hypothetical protein [Clostridia bacterium]